MRLRTVADEEGLPLAERKMTYNSRLAQELGKWAESKGKGHEFHKAVFYAYFVKDQPIDEIQVLAKLAESVNLNVKDAQKILQNRTFKEAVDLDWKRSYELNITEIPTFILNHQVLVGGVDSYLDLQLLATLDGEDRILAEGVMDGFAPGEGAGFMLVQLAGGGAASAVKVYPPGISEESGHRYSQLPYMGDGLANAVAESLTNVSSGKIKTVFSSFNGENFSAKEWSVAALRNQQNLDVDFMLVHPADCYGDLGAATVPVLMIIASIGMMKGYYTRPALLWASSEIQQRAAVYLV